MSGVYILSEDNKFISQIRRLPFGDKAEAIKNIIELPKKENGVIIMYKTGAEDISIPPQYIAVAWEEDRGALKTIEESGLRVVTCGFSSTSTLNISAVAEDEISFEIQRKMNALDGSIYEEGEMPMKLPLGADEEAAMLWAAAAMIKLGEKEFRHLFDI